MCKKNRFQKRLLLLLLKGSKIVGATLENIKIFINGTSKWNVGLDIPTFVCLWVY